MGLNALGVVAYSWEPTNPKLTKNTKTAEEQGIVEKKVVPALVHCLPFSACGARAMG